MQYELMSFKFRFYVCMSMQQKCEMCTTLTNFTAAPASESIRTGRDVKGTL